MRLSFTNLADDLSDILAFYNSTKNSQKTSKYLNKISNNIQDDSDFYSKLVERDMVTVSGQLYPNEIINLYDSHRSKTIVYDPLDVDQYGNSALRLMATFPINLVSDLMSRCLNHPFWAQKSKDLIFNVIDTNNGEALSYLLNFQEISPNIDRGNGLTPIQHAINVNNLNAVRMLLNCSNIDLKKPYLKSVPYTSWLVKKYYAGNAVDVFLKCNAVENAIVNGWVDIIKFLLKSDKIPIRNETITLFTDTVQLWINDNYPKNIENDLLQDVQSCANLMIDNSRFVESINKEEMALLDGLNLSLGDLLEASNENKTSMETEQDISAAENISDVLGDI